MRLGDLYFSAQCAVEYIVRWNTIDDLVRLQCRLRRVERSGSRRSVRAGLLGPRRLASISSFVT